MIRGPTGGVGPSNLRLFPRAMQHLYRTYIRLRRFGIRAGFLVSAVLLFTMVEGCYNLRVGTGVRSANRHDTVTAASYFWGLVKPRDTLGDDRLNTFSTVEVRRDFGQSLVSLLTLGIYSPMTFYGTMESCDLQPTPPVPLAPLDIRLVNSDYPVPTPAALCALQSEEGPLFLETSSARSATVATRGLWNNDAHHLAVGAEFAPFLLGDGTSLSEYLSGRLKRVLLRTRVSFAVDISGGSGFRSALGLRWMLHDDADLRADSLFAQTVTRWGSQRRTPNFDSLRDALKDLYWNRSVFEMALAATYRSVTDAEGEAALVVGQYHGFFSAGFPMLGRSGQVQFGASGWGGFDGLEPRYQRQGALTFRSFYGSASERLFAGVRLVGANLSEPDYRLEVGGLLRLGNGFWIRPDLGASLLHRSQHGPEASITLSFGTPEIRNR